MIQFTLIEFKVLHSSCTSFFSDNSLENCAQLSSSSSRLSHLLRQLKTRNCHVKLLTAVGALKLLVVPVDGSVLVHDPRVRNDNETQCAPIQRNDGVLNLPGS